MKMKPFVMKFSLPLLFGMVVTACTTISHSLVDVAYSTGWTEVHFIDSEKVTMYFSGETLDMTYSYDASSRSGKIISGGTVSAEIYNFTIKNAYGNTPEELILTSNTDAVQQVLAVEPESFHMLELGQLVGEFFLQRKRATEEETSGAPMPPAAQR